ncbi:MAG: glycogen debranching protein [Syntrophomonadaceae bacterium]|nr:glycogen debranching protein [Syntrophomonadaceae bacterium]
MFTYSPSDLLPPQGKTKEWLLTNGIGGFAGSTISGINTRRYHGLLTAALRPPVDRRLLLAKLEEEIIVDEKSYSLFSSETVGGTSGQGFNYLQGFRRFPLPTYIYQLEDCILEKEIMMVFKGNTVMVKYSLTNRNGRKVRLNIFPLITSRDYHGILRQNHWPFTVTPVNNNQQVAVEPYSGAPWLYIGSDRAQIIESRFWYNSVYYQVEAERGLDAVEDYFCPVHFRVDCRESMTFWVVAGTDQIHIGSSLFQGLRDQELQRLRKLVDLAPSEDWGYKALVLAADSFLVKRADSENLTVIAGYPWFADWGRDAMIALPGLTLPTQRFGDYRQVISTFLDNEKDGLLPNLFPDTPGPAAYNTADAAMWLFWSLYKYLQYTQDWEFLRKHYPVLLRILESHIQGTHYGIKMNDRGLITQGEETKALTWMDARVGNVVVTPRRGMTVEINSLWYLALCLVSHLGYRFGDSKRALYFKDLARRVKESFRELFWFNEGGYLYDTVGNDGVPDKSIRCNQIIAVSLPIRLLTAGQERRVLETVWTQLYAGLGLRTLSPGSNDYKGRCTGDQYARDSAYHQGTVWVWPWGHFITAIKSIYGKEPGTAELIHKMTAPLMAHLNEAGIGTVSEIFDGDPPHYPRGCVAQAWSVAEVLRVIYENTNDELADINVESEE